MRRKIIFLPFLLIITILFAVYSLDIKQENPETLFLTESGKNSYLQFKDDFNEVQYLIAVHELTEKETISEVAEKVEKFKTKYSDFEFIIPDQTKQKLADQMTLKLLGEKHFGFMVIGEKGSFKNIIQELKDQNVWKMTGLPYTNFNLDEYSKDIQDKLFPTMFILAFIMSLLITRNVMGAIFIFVPSLTSALMSLGLLKFWFESMNMVTSIVPLLSFVITLALGFHLYYSVMEFGSFKEALRHKFKPIALMIGTTGIGFGALLTSEIPVIANFGVMVALMVLVSTIFMILFFYWGEELIKKYGSFQLFKARSLSEKFFENGFSKYMIGFISGVIFTVGLITFPSLEVLTDATRYFPKSSGLKTEMDWVSHNVAGIPLFDILVEARGDEWETVEKMAKLESEITAKLPKGMSIISPVAMVKDINLLYSGSQSLPENKFAFFALFSRIPQAMKDSYPLDNVYRFTVSGEAVNVDEFNQDLELVKSKLRESGIEYKVNGLYYHLMSSQESMINVLFQSFSLSVLLVSVLSFLYFRKLKILFIFALVNTIPVLFSFIFMKIVGFSINIATVMTYSISIGLVVDSSFHIIHNLGEGKNTFGEYVRTTVTPILASTLVFVVSFLIFLRNSFLPIKQFGGILAFILFIGMILDLYFLPTLYLGTSKVKEMFK